MAILLLVCIFVIWYGCVIVDYKKSSYYQVTKQPYFKMRFDLGPYGEYLTYVNLKSYEMNGAKFLFNCYIPKTDGETTEIDVLLIDQSGIYVFESKNYSGWIFGKEDARMWMQTLPQGRGKKAHKEKFLNPIMQNKLHIQCLEKMLVETFPIHSVIVFSDRCEFKDLKICSNSIKVIHRSEVRRIVERIKNHYGDVMTSEAVDRIYNKLYNCTQVSEQVKQAHVEKIQTKQLVHIVPPSKDDQHNEVLNGQTDNIIFMNAKSIEKEVKFVCPKCGAGLVLRMAKKGANQGKEFYGCSNYPKCRYIKNLNDE